MGNRNVPEVRFSGFSGDWEERKFKDFISKSGKKNIEEENYPAFSVSNKLGLISQSEQFDNSRLDDLDKKTYKIVKPDEFAYNPARINVGSIAFNNLNKTVIVSSLYVVIKMSEALNNDYIIHYIKSQAFIDEVKRNTEGSVREYLFFDSFKNIKFPYLSNYEEQNQIGKFFKQLDETIAIQEQELTTLKQTKQGFLQKMFPKEGETVPELRFPGFSGDWKKCRLADETKIIAGGDIDKSKISVTGKYPVLANALTNDGIVGYYKNEYRIEAPAVTVTGRGDVGHAKARRFCFTPVVRLLAIKSEHDVDFLENAINNHKIMIESTGVPQLTSPQLGNYQIYFSSFDEEKRIGDFFRNINNVIALHEQELEALKKTKQAFLQKMFV